MQQPTAGAGSVTVQCSRDVCQCWRRSEKSLRLRVMTNCADVSTSVNGMEDEWLSLTICKTSQCLKCRFNIGCLGACIIASDFASKDASLDRVQGGRISLWAYSVKERTQVIWEKLTWRVIAAMLPPGGQSCTASNNIIMRFEGVFKFEASVWKTPWI